MGKRINALRKQVKRLEKQLEEVTTALAKLGGKVKPGKESKPKKTAAKSVKKASMPTKKKLLSKPGPLPELEPVDTPA